MNSSLMGSLRIGRIGTRERESVAWLKCRLFLYTSPFFSSQLLLRGGLRGTCD